MLLTVSHLLRLGSARLCLRDDLQETATQDARQLLQMATGLSRVEMLATPERAVGAEVADRYDALLERRLRAEPVQYLRGSQEFYGREFAVSPAVLIPRPETELIVDTVLRLFADRAWPLRMADVGTGSGVLAVTLALEYPHSMAVGLDVSPEALAVARMNAEALGLGRRMLMGDVRFSESDLLAAVHDESFDVIVSNPPYVPLVDLPTLHAQVREHEPHLALFGGADGHDVLRRLVPQAWARLVPGGWLLLETAGRTPVLDTLLRGWSDVEFVRDLQGIERIAVARRS